MWRGPSGEWPVWIAARSRADAGVCAMVTFAVLESQAARPRASSELGAPRFSETPARLHQVLRQHLDVCEHRHEVRVAAPARNDVEVHMVKDPGARDAAGVPAEVVTVRPVGGSEAFMPREASRWISTSSASSSPAKSPCAELARPAGARTRTGTCSGVRAPRSPAHADPSSSALSTASQKKQPSCASAFPTYSSRQGAQSCFVTGT